MTIAQDVNALRRTPGRPRSLTLEQVVDAALALLDRDGLEAVSIRGLANALEVTPPTVYSYVASKDALLRAMMDRFFESHPRSDPIARDWVGELRASYLAHFASYSHSPNMVRLILSSDVTSERAVELLEANLELLVNAGFSFEQSYIANRALNNHLLGAAMSEGARIAPGRSRSAPSVEHHPLLERFGQTMRAMEPAEVFAAGLDMLLATIERLPRNRARRPRALSQK
jgi:AcrR family transcriptional regulator